MAAPPATQLLRIILLALSSWSAGAALAHEGWGIVVDQRGQVYFSDIPTNTIWRLTTDRRLEAVARDKHSHALVIDDEGNIYGTHHSANEQRRSVWRVAADGQLTDVVPPSSEFPLHLQSFLMDADGNVYSENPYHPDRNDFLLLRRTPDGAVSLVAGGTRGLADGRGPEARFTRIDGMAFGPDGAIYVTDGPYVRRVSSDGAVTTLHPDPMTTTRWGEDLMGLTVEENGTIFVADYSGRRLIQLSGDGRVGRVHRTGGLAWSPTGVTVQNGDLYLLEHLRMPLVIFGDVQIGPYARVQRISESGAVEQLVTVWGRNTGIVIVAALCISVVAVAVTRQFRRRRQK